MKVIRIKAPVVEQPPDTLAIELTWKEAVALGAIRLGLGDGVFVPTASRDIARALLDEIKRKISPDG